MPGVGKRCIAESSVDAGAAVAHLQREQCCIGTRCGAPVPGVTGGVHEAPETLSSRSFALRHHEQMLANAVSQRAVWMMPRPLNYRLGDAVSAHVAPRNGGASVSGANWMYGASVTVSSSFTLLHHAWMQANAVSQLGSLDVGGAAAELPLGRCCIGARCAQKWWRICFGGK